MFKIFNRQTNSNHTNECCLKRVIRNILSDIDRKIKSICSYFFVAVFINLNIDKFKSLSKVDLKSKSISVEDRKNIADILVYSIGNRILNDRLSSILSSKKHRQNLRSKGVKLSVIKKLRYFSFKTEKQKKFIEILKKCDKVIDHINNNKNIEPKDKLSPNDYKLLISWASIRSTIRPYCKKTNSKKYNSAELNQIYCEIKKAERVCDKFNKIINKEKCYRNGDFAVYAQEKFDKYSPAFDWKCKVKSILVTDYDHMMSLVRVDGKTMQSHVYDTYSLDPFSVPDELLSEIWRVDPVKLLDKNSDYYKALKLIYGKNCDKKINQYYYKIQGKIHQNTEIFEGIENDIWRRIRSGLADFRLAGSHKKSKSNPNEFRRLHKNMTEGFKNSHKKQMICSEFVAKSLIAALVELDDTLKNKLYHYKVNSKTKNPELIAKVKDDIKKRKNDLMFFNIPFSKHERLKRLHTGRVIKILKDHHCIEMLKPKKVLANIFRL